jgi:hypothetical protein
MMCSQDYGLTLVPPNDGRGNNNVSKIPLRRKHGSENKQKDTNLRLDTQEETIKQRERTRERKAK